MQAVRYRSWCLSFIVTGGLLIGCFFGRVFLSPAMSQLGPPGDMAGAAGVLLLLVCFSAAIIFSSDTVILCQIFYHCKFEKFLIRFLSCLAGGVLTGVLSALYGSWLSWFLLLVTILLPIALSWPSEMTRKNFSDRDKVVDSFCQILQSKNCF